MRKPEAMCHASDPALHLDTREGLTVRRFDPERCKMDGQPPFPVWIGKRGESYADATVVALTDRDVEFLRTALSHYRTFAEVAEKQGEERTAGILRKQEFYAERFLARIEKGGEEDGD